MSDAAAAEPAAAEPEPAAVELSEVEKAKRAVQDLVDSRTGDLPQLPDWLNKVLVSDTFQKDCSARFDELDKDRNGVLTADELGPLAADIVGAHPLDVTEEDCIKIIQKFSDGKDSLSRSVFAELVRYALVHQFDRTGSWGKRKVEQLQNKDAAGGYAADLAAVRLDNDKVMRVIDEIQTKRDAINQVFPWMPTSLKDFMMQKTFREKVESLFAELDSMKQDVVEAELLFPAVQGLAPAAPLGLDRPGCRALTLIYHRAGDSGDTGIPKEKAHDFARFLLLGGFLATVSPDAAKYVADKWAEEQRVLRTIRDIEKDRKTVARARPYLPGWLRETIEGEDFSHRCNAEFRTLSSADGETPDAVPPSSLFPVVVSLSSAQPISITAEHCERFASLFDTNNDGVIQREEFGDFVVFLWTSSFLAQDTDEATRARQLASEAVRLTKGGERARQLLDMVRLSRRQLEGVFPRLPGALQDALYTPDFEAQALQSFDAADADGAGWLAAAVLRPVLQAVGAAFLPADDVSVGTEHCDALLPVVTDKAGVSRADFLGFARLVLVCAFLQGRGARAEAAEATGAVAEAGRAEAAALLAKLRGGRAALKGPLGELPAWLHSALTAEAFQTAAEAQFDALDAENAGSLEPAELFSVITQLVQEQPVTVRMALCEELSDQYGGAWILRADFPEFARAVVAASWFADMAEATLPPPAEAEDEPVETPFWSKPSTHANYQSLDPFVQSELEELRAALAALLATPQEVAPVLPAVSTALRGLATDANFRVQCTELATSAEARIPEAAYVSADVRAAAEDATFRGAGLVGLIEELAALRGLSPAPSFAADAEALHTLLAGPGKAPRPRSELLFLVARGVFLAASLRERIAEAERKRGHSEDALTLAAGFSYAADQFVLDMARESATDIWNMVLQRLPVYFKHVLTVPAFSAQCEKRFDDIDRLQDGRMDVRILLPAVQGIAQDKEVEVSETECEKLARHFTGDGMTVSRDSFGDFMRFVLGIAFLRSGPKDEAKKVLTGLQEDVRALKEKMSTNQMLSALKKDKAAVEKVFKFLPKWLQDWIGAGEFSVECLREFDDYDGQSEGKLPAGEMHTLLVNIAYRDRESPDDDVKKISISPEQTAELVELFGTAEDGFVLRDNFIDLAKCVFVHRFLTEEVEAAKAVAKKVADDELDSTDHKFLQSMLKKVQTDRKAVLEVVPHLPAWVQEWLASPHFALECSERFQALDVDGSGSLEPRELYSSVTALSATRGAAGARELHIQEDHCEELCSIFDRDGKGSLSQDEFAEFARFCVVMNWMRQEAQTRSGAEGEAGVENAMEMVMGDLRLKALLAMLRAEREALADVLLHLPVWLQQFLTSQEFEQQCRERFDRVDKDHSGAVDPEELAPILEALHEGHPMSVTPAHCKEFAELFDVDQSGTISREEFSEFVRFSMAMSFLYHESGKHNIGKAVAPDATAIGPIGFTPGEASNSLVEQLADGLQQSRKELAETVEENERLKVELELKDAELSSARAELDALQASSTARTNELEAEVDELRREREAKGDTQQVMNLARDVRHLQVDLEAAVRKGETLLEERSTLAVAVERLQRELEAAVETIEERDQQVRHLQIDIAAAKAASPDPQTAVSNAIALASHHALHQEQRLRARAEEKTSWLHEKLQETTTLLQNEQLEATRLRRKLEHARPAAHAPAAGKADRRVAPAGPLAPYKLDSARAMGMTATDSSGKKWGAGSTGKLPNLRQTS